MNMIKRIHRTGSVLLLFVIFTTACGGITATPTPVTTEIFPNTEVIPAQESKIPLVVFGAGSLIIPFNHLETAFETRYPNIDVQAEYHGSIQVIRHVSELHESIDVVATADASLIPMLMYEVINLETGEPYADWYISFATNKLAVAYTSTSKYADEINGDNWYEVLSRRDVRVGMSDPRFDPSGYRTLMAFALANDHYQQPKIYTNMFNGRFATPVTIFQDDDQTTITVPEIFEGKPETGLLVRGASIQLLALLESGDLDYAFEYESVTRQHGLEMVSLPDALNLGNEENKAAYQRVVVELDFRRFASIEPVFRGEYIGYAVTIPSSAPHPEEAALFISFLLSEEGRTLMQEDFHPVFDPPIGDNYNNIPGELQVLCEPKP
ncbi:MAG: tungstate ABC transporter substrate-binding protein WtpA [Anaerolineales bacterium]|nr:tungstate ABC transporter substrate-binding protein WtpA [Anaerolineales bacterium]